MKHFLRHASDQLYKLDPPSRTPHEVYLVLPAPLSQKEAPIPLSEAVQNATGHNGLLVFTGQAMNIANQGRADWFVDQIVPFSTPRPEQTGPFCGFCQTGSRTKANIFLWALTATPPASPPLCRFPL